MDNTKTLCEYSQIRTKGNSVIYTLTQNNKFFPDSGWVTVYGVKVCEYCEGKIVGLFQTLDYSSIFEKALNLVNVLLKNKVMPNEMDDLIEDFL